MKEPTLNGGPRRRSLSPILATDDYRIPSSVVTFDCAARSHRGSARPHNEDHYLIVELGRSQDVLLTSLPPSDLYRRFEEHSYAMVVADGIGGRGAGAVASRVALATLAHLALHYGRWNMRVDGRTASEIVERAEWFYRHVSEAVQRRAIRDPLLSGMATTMTAAYSAGTDLFVAHVGHSRAYVYRDGDLTRLTSDETVKDRLTKPKGRPQPVDRATEDLTHILTETIGSASRLTVDVEQFKIRDGDCVLLCTDGLTGHVDDERIANVLGLGRRLDEQCEQLINLALEQGGPDNITVVLAQYRVPRL